ncbi:MAG: 4a-hydroxytetrahydrobiopterin dehydratase [Candidatus Dormibacteraeota bacterium]|nr:4a-hydroxytetrahydrobiopterin dehydratase [Candidatus Dormibacteraeota bacterium]
MARLEPLTDLEASERLTRLSGWQIDGGRLTKRFGFGDFMGAVDFVNQIARVAETQRHHPDLEVGWGRVVVTLMTHSAGGLTDKDFGLAALIEAL